MNVLIILMLILCGAFMAMSCNDDFRDSIRALFSVASAILVLVSAAILVRYEDSRVLDVYRGKTELKTIKYYKDDTLVKTDSVVVWKEK